MCYKYARSFPAARATAEALHRCHVPRRWGRCVRTRRDHRHSPSAVPSPRHTATAWGCPGHMPGETGLSATATASHRQPKGSDSCSRENTGAATTPPVLGGAATLRRHRLRVKHLLKCPCLQPGTQGWEQFFVPRRIESCCPLCCTEVAILMEMPVAAPTRTSKHSLRISALVRKDPELKINEIHF